MRCRQGLENHGSPLGAPDPVGLGILEGLGPVDRAQALQQAVLVEPRRRFQHLLDLVRAGRPESSDLEDVVTHVAWGPGPRASQALMLACRARAVLDGRLSPSLDDVMALAPPVLRHRMALNFAARAEGVTMDSILARLCERLA